MKSGFSNPPDAGQAIGVPGPGPHLMTSSRWSLLALAAVFVLPFAIGSGLYWSGWRPVALRNHGELIQPPRTLPSAGALHGKWLLIVPARDGCTQTCQAALQQLQRVHAALGKNQGRVQRVVVATGTAPIQQQQALTVVSPATEAETAWRQALDDFAPAVFVADPLGNVMMRYGEPIDARSILRDMERLLKYSWIR